LAAIPFYAFNPPQDVAEKNWEQSRIRNAEDLAEA
jgi:hypothetical protein